MVHHLVVCCLSILLRQFAAVLFDPSAWILDYSTLGIECLNSHHFIKSDGDLCFEPTKHVGLLLEPKRNHSKQFLTLHRLHHLLWTECRSSRHRYRHTGIHQNHHLFIALEGLYSTLQGATCCSLKSSSHVIQWSSFCGTAEGLTNWSYLP